MFKTSQLFDNFLKSPIKLKIFFSFIFIFFAIIMVSISFVVNYNYENKFMNQDIHKKATSLIDSKLVMFKHHMDMYRFSLEAVSNNDIFKSYLKTSTNKKDAASIFETIIGSDNNIMQIRYIDQNGMENIRFDRSERGLRYKKVNDKDLQNKKDRYYFKEVSTLKESSPMWISDIDLNIENGKVQQPHVPTVRFAKPVYSDNEFKGIVILNIFMKDILKSLTNSPMFTISLLDKEGEFLIGKKEIDGSVVDYSWSKYLLKEVDIKHFAPKYINQILNSYEFHSELFHTKRISAQL